MLAKPGGLDTIWVQSAGNWRHGAATSFLGEFKRSKIFNAVYAVVAWLLVQIGTAIEAPLNLPEWVDTFVIVLLAAGFPITPIMRWAFNLTSEGLALEMGESAPTKMGGPRIDYVSIGALAAESPFYSSTIICSIAPGPAQRCRRPKALRRLNRLRAFEMLRFSEALLGDRRLLVSLPEIACGWCLAGGSDAVARILAELNELAAGGAGPGAGGWAQAYHGVDDRDAALERFEVAAGKDAANEPDAGLFSLRNLKMNVANHPRLRQPEFVAVFNRIRGDQSWLEREAFAKA